MQKGRTSVCSGRVPYRGRVPPILPAVVKSELKDLLALSPVLLSDFEKAFAKRFGRSFQYMQYGFLSMFEVLNAASDVISVEQTRAGSLLTLKKTASEEKQRGWPAGKFMVGTGNWVMPTDSQKYGHLNKIPQVQPQLMPQCDGGHLRRLHPKMKSCRQLMAAERENEFFQRQVL